MPLYNFNQDLSTGITGRVYRKFGENPNASTSKALIWPLNSSPDAYPWPTTAQTVDLTSSDPADNGMIILVQGLNAVGLEISEPTAVGTTTTNTFYRVYRLIVTGTTVNAGQIEAKHGADILAVIASGDGQTQQCFGTIPANQRVYITQFLLALGANRGATFEFWIRDVSTPFLKQMTFYIQDTSVIVNVNPNTVIDPLTDWYVSAELTQAGGVAAQLFGRREVII